MGKVQILAVLTIDGCLSSELYGKVHKELSLDRCGIDEIRKNALYRVTPDYSISMLHEWRKDGTNTRYLAEATPDTADYINGLIRMHAVDEIILYTIPFIAGTGRHFFKSALPEQHWTLSSSTRDIVEFYNKRGGKERIFDDMNNGWLHRQGVLEPTLEAYH